PLPVLLPASVGSGPVGSFAGSAPDSSPTLAHLSMLSGRGSAPFARRIARGRIDHEDRDCRSDSIPPRSALSQSRSVSSPRRLVSHFPLRLPPAHSGNDSSVGRSSPPQTGLGCIPPLQPDRYLHP